MSLARVDAKSLANLNGQACIDPKMLSNMWTELPAGHDKVDYKLKFKRGSKPVVANKSGL